MSGKRSRTSEVTGRVLVVDDHASARESMAETLQHVGHDVDCCSGAGEALHRLQSETYDIILTDLRMPGMDGVEFIKELERIECEAQVVMITAFASVETAVVAMRHGAFDYIEKPFDIDQLENLVNRALSHGSLVGKRSTVLPSGEATHQMLGTSPAMMRLQEQVARAAATDVTVLICGESGTGKELVAKTLHRQSERRNGPMVSLNCPALSPQLMESELFGHEKGAFTSADAPRVGRFELADGGTILLDEISEIELSLQAKLLRVLQERCFERVGSSQTRPVDVRVVATTNRNLQEEVAKGNFREDLYYRLAVVPLEVPALRQRADDVPLLADHFLNKAAARLDRSPLELSTAARDLLLQYEWPGNVRELENLMTRATVMTGGDVVNDKDLEPWLIGHAAGVEWGERQRGDVSEQAAQAVTCREPSEKLIEAGVSLQEMERALIEATLEKFEGHREKTAKALGIGVRTLTSRLRSFGYAPREKSFINRTASKAA